MNTVMKTVVGVCIIACLQGCATESDFTGGPPDANRSRDYARCETQWDATPAAANAAANPFYSAAALQSYVNSCMKAAGYIGP